MPLVDSRQQMLQVGELLKIASENTESEYPPEFLYATFVKEVQMPDSKFLRYGNVLYLIHGSPKDPRKGQFRALNADIAQNFLQSGFQFVIDAYKAGFDVLATEFKDQSLLNIFRTVAKNPPNPGMGYQVEMTQDGQYRVTLQLGTPRQGVR
jgi:hypothetical protein